MKKIKICLAFIMLTSLIWGCKKDKNTVIDTEYPEVNVVVAEAFPKQCSELVRGSTVTAKIVVSDNVELGSVSIDIHHNFDQHTHSTEVDDCGLDNKKTPVNPLTLIRTIPVQAGSKTYTANTNIEIPSTIDPGDYHFMIRVTDKEGWQTMKGLSIKIK